MSIETARSFFLWCSVINYAVLLVWVALALFGRNGLLRLWGRWFRISPEQFDMLILYAAISEASSNRWNFSVISDSRLSAWVVESPSMTSLMAA